MKALLHVEFITQGHGNQGFARLRIADLPFVPYVGMKLEQMVWKDGKAVGCSSWNVEDQSLYIILEPDMVAPDSAADHRNMYVQHGWTLDQ